MGNRLLGLVFGVLCLSILSSALGARADEGLQRITTLGDRDLLAQNKTKVKPKPRYKSVDDESDGREYFKGRPFPQTSNAFFGLGFDYFDAFGLQARYAARVVDKGFIPDINNSFYIEGGLGLTFYGAKANQSGVTGFDLIVTGRWDFQMDPTWTFFGDAGFGYNIVSSGVKNEDVKGGGLFPAIGIGAMYNVNSEWSARFDLSYQFLGVGVLHRF